VSQKSKCSIRVRSSRGDSWTTRRGARRLVTRGLAIVAIDGSLEMIEHDHRFDAQAQVRQQSPKLVIVRRYEMPGDYRQRELGLPNFARVPSRHRTSIGKKAA
jgi:hypothetical protein